MAAFGDRVGQQREIAAAQTIQQWAASDPQVQQILRAQIDPRQKDLQLQARARATGHTLTGWHLNAGGQVVPDDSAWEGVGVAGLGFGGLGALSAGVGTAAPVTAGTAGGSTTAAGGTAAGTGGSTAATAADVTGPTLEQLGASPAATSALTGGGSAAATSKSIWDKIAAVSPLIAAGAGLGGAAIAAHGATSAADTAAAAADRARQTQIDLFNLEQGQLSPYRSAGQGAVGQLAYGFGVPGFEGGPTSHAAPPMPTLPGGTTNFASLATPGTPGTPSVGTSGTSGTSGGMVTVKSPNGQVGQIPANRLNDALAAGGQQVMS